MGSTSTANYKMSECGLEGAFETYGTDHTMIRVKDANRSIAFYRDQMGMKVLNEMKVVSERHRERVMAKRGLRFVL